MKSHELAKLLLSFPDLPVATEANNHEYFSVGDGTSHGQLRIAICHHYSGDHLLIGNISRRMLNEPNWYVKEMLHGEAPNEWPYEKVINHHGDRRWVYPKSYPGVMVKD